nr:MAG TPA: hypothetical protein [Caudoviricetes sp.]
MGRDVYAGRLSGLSRNGASLCGKRKAGAGSHTAATTINIIEKGANW